MPRVDWGEAVRVGLAGGYFIAMGSIILGLSLVPFALVSTPAYYGYEDVRKRRNRLVQP